ncbi:MAG TPA: septum formation initiator family protein [Gaiellaceae bacterium]|nr:septum formation initiator family protein [Gaiellaceae bacterium]
MIRLRPTRLLAIGALALVAFLYWRPIHTYLRTKQALQARHAQVHALSTEKATLERKIALANTGPELLRQGRMLGLVRPSEQLFIVRGVSAWRHRNR